MHDRMAVLGFTKKYKYSVENRNKNIPNIYALDGFILFKGKGLLLVLSILASMLDSAY
tara:strand:+ start:790 stop:963 length:174 start_codon:yes stop_codon:yes gene_type:complete